MESNPPLCGLEDPGSEVAVLNLASVPPKEKKVCSFILMSTILKEAVNLASSCEAGAGIVSHILHLLHGASVEHLPVYADLP